MRASTCHRRRPPPATGRRGGTRVAPGGIGLALVLALLPVFTPPAQAQALGGQVVDSTSRHPVPRLRVRLLAVTDTTETEVDSTLTDGRGLFQMIVPAPGRYQLEFGLRAPRVSLGPIDALTGADTTVTRRYALPIRRWSQETPFTTDETTVPVRPDHRSGAPRYPSSLLREGVRGCVVAALVVDTLGLVEAGSLQILSSSDSLFAVAVRAAVPEFRYAPATLGGVVVRQHVVQPFEFALESPRGQSTLHGSWLDEPDRPATLGGGFVGLPAPERAPPRCSLWPPAR